MFGLLLCTIIQMFSLSEKFFQIRYFAFFHTMSIVIQSSLRPVIIVIPEITLILVFIIAGSDNLIKLMINWRIVNGILWQVFFRNTIFDLIIWCLIILAWLVKERVKGLDTQVLIFLLLTCSLLKGLLLLLIFIAQFMLFRSIFARLFSSLTHLLVAVALCGTIILLWCTWNDHWVTLRLLLIGLNRHVLHTHWRLGTIRLHHLRLLHLTLIASHLLLLRHTGLFLYINECAKRSWNLLTLTSHHILLLLLKTHWVMSYGIESLFLLLTLDWFGSLWFLC